MKVLYTTSAVSTGGREGSVEVLGSPLKFDMAPPVEIGGSGKEGTNPEQLFAAGYAACFGSAVQFVIHKEKMSVSEFSITAEVSIGTQEDGGYALGVALALRVSGIDQKAAEALVSAAHQVCPYSKATRGNIDVVLSAKAQ